jgi:iron complex transport system ATP-binding protein
MDITLGYGSRNVVQGLSLELLPGMITGLVGPNGCGKSTIIKALSRVLPLRGGRVSLNGRNIQAIPRTELACLLGVVPQIPLLPSTFSAFEIVLMGRNPHLGLLQYEGSRDRAIAAEAMRQTGTQHLAQRKIGELSGGEVQSVVVARVLAQQPQAILMDEPTANLDVGRQIEIMDLMRQLCRQQGLTIGVALHDLNLAAQYCDRMILLRGNGTVKAEGIPQQVITPENITDVYGAGNTVYDIDGFPAVLPRAGIR